MELKEKEQNKLSDWVGGFSGSDLAFLYLNPDLSSLPIPDNMLNIDKL